VFTDPSNCSRSGDTVFAKGAHIFQTFSKNFKILNIRSTFHTEKPQILGATVKKVSRSGNLPSELFVKAAQGHKR
jgi:hypothetical protein